MKRTYPLLFLVAASLVMTAGAAMAQPSGLTRHIRVDDAGPLSSNLILERWTKPIESDLKISDDVAEKLTLLRVEYRVALRKAYEEAGIDPNKLPTGDQFQTYNEITQKVLREFLPKAAALLSSEQIKRLEQIDFQIDLRLQGPAGLLRRDVASALNLTNDQRRTLNALSGEYRTKQREPGFDRAPYLDKAVEVLRDDQKEVLSKLRGEEFSQNEGLRQRPPVGSAPAQQPGKMPITFPIRFPSVELVHFAAIEAVQKDLGVSDEVAQKLTLLRDDYRAAYQKECQAADILQSWGPINAAFPKLGPIGKKLDDEFIPKVNALLSADQQQRFQQIRFQGSLRNQFPKALLDVASVLKLTDDQQQKLTALNADRRQMQVPAPGPARDKGFSERYSKIQEEYRTKALEVLTAEQKATLDTLKGKEFDLSQLVIRGRTRDT